MSLASRDCRHSPAPVKRSSSILIRRRTVDPGGSGGRRHRRCHRHHGTASVSFLGQVWVQRRAPERQHHSRSPDRADHGSWFIVNRPEASGARLPRPADLPVASESDSLPEPNAIYEALQLVVKAASNSDDVRRVLAEHPYVLSPVGVTLARAVAHIQTTAEGRAAGEEISLLIELCTEHGVDGGIERYMAQVPQLRAQTRLRAARAAEMERSRRSVKPEAVPDWAKALSDRTPASLHDCVEEMRVEAESVGAQSFPLEARHGAGRPVPPFLYRGESGLYRESRSSLARLVHDSNISEKAFEQIVMVTETARSALMSQWRFDALEASAFLQHYGLPTDWLDLTDDLRVAASFASSLHVGQLGAIASLRTSLLLERGEVFNLSRRSVADRPQRQHAWVFSSTEHRDLKDTEAIRALGIRWRLFRLDEDDVARYHVDSSLLDAHSDPVAGLLELVVNGVGKLTDDAARWLAGRLEPAPFAALTLPARHPDDGIRLRLLSADEMGMSYDRESRRRQNIEAWSERYAPVQQKELPSALRDALVTMDDIRPGSVLHILSPAAFSLLERTEDEEPSG
jgi:hypothetical protein